MRSPVICALLLRFWTLGSAAAKKCKCEGINVKAGGVEGGGRVCRCSVTFEFYCYAHFTFLGSLVSFLRLHNCRRYPRNFPLQVQQKSKTELAANHWFHFMLQFVTEHYINKEFVHYTECVGNNVSQERFNGAFEKLGEGNMWRDNVFPPITNMLTCNG